MLVTLVVLGTWAFELCISRPTLLQARQAGGYTIGPYNSDSYSSWSAAYALLWQGRDPYSPAVTADIQRGVFGRVLAPDDPVRITNAFVYPLYIIFVLGPTTLIPIAVLFPLWYGLVLGLTGLTVWLWLRALDWRLGRLPTCLLMLLGISTFPAVDTIQIQQPTALVAVFLAASAASLPRRRYVLAGILLALAMIKPQVSAGLVLWLGAWSLRDWPARRGLVVGFAGTLTILLAGATALLPGWLPEWIAALSDYQGYATQPLLGVWLPAAAVPWAFVLLLAITAPLAWRALRAMPGSLLFSLGLALAGLYTVLLLPAQFFYNELLLYPAVLLVLQYRGAITALGRAGRWIYMLTTTWLIWPWLAAICMLAAWIGAPVVSSTAQAGITRFYQVPWIAALFLPLLLFLPLGSLAWHDWRAPTRR